MRKGACKHRNLPNGGGRSVLTVRRPSPGNVSERVKRDDRGRHVSHLRRRRMGLVIGTRADPALPLATEGSRGARREIPATDFRFTGDEVVSYSMTSMALTLRPLT